MKDFTNGNITKQILLFTFPMLIGNLFQQFYSMADTIVVGRYVSGNALASVGVASNVLQFLLAVLIGLTTGASVLIAQYYGAKQFEKLERTLSTSVVFLAVFSIVIAAAGILFSPFILRLLDTDQEIMKDAVLYLRVLMAGMVFPVFYNMYTAYLRALGDSNGPLLILICCTILNVGLDLLFVIQFHMGVFGAAAATIIAQALSAVLSFIYAAKRVKLLHIQKIIFDRAIFGSILKYGAPAALQLSLVSFANLTITKLINSFGNAAMAGITAAAKIDQLATMPVSTVNMALAAFVGQNMGAGKEERAKEGLRTSMITMLILAVFISAVLIVFRHPLIALFLDKTDAAADAILKVGTDYLNILVLFYFLFAFLFAFNGFFRGTGDAVIAMVFPIVSLSIRAIAAHLFVNLAGMGPEALAWSIPLGWGICSFLSWIYYRKRLWAGKLAAGLRES